MQKIYTRTAIGYICAQLVGAALGSLPLLAWGAMGRSVDFGATVPGEGYMLMDALLGEVVTTFALVAGLCIFIGFRGLRRFTPFLMPPLYAVMVTLETALSGTSTNPARTFGPALISGRWDAWWIYWVGPLAGTSFIGWPALTDRHAHVLPLRLPSGNLLDRDACLKPLALGFEDHFRVD